MTVILKHPVVNWDTAGPNIFVGYLMLTSTWPGIAPEHRVATALKGFVHNIVSKFIARDNVVRTDGNPPCRGGWMTESRQLQGPSS